MSTPELITREHAAELSGYTFHTLAQMASTCTRTTNKGFPTPQRIGLRVYYDKNAVEKWARENPPELRKTRGRKIASSTRRKNNASQICQPAKDITEVTSASKKTRTVRIRPNYDGPARPEPLRSDLL